MTSETTSGCTMCVGMVSVSNSMHAWLIYSYSAFMSILVFIIAIPSGMKSVTDYKHIIMSHIMHSACGPHADNLALDNRKPQSVDLATSTSEVATTLQEPIV